MISTRNLDQLPDIDALRRIMQSMALLDAILCPEWESRYYSFNAAWAPGEQMGSMRNGSGDDLFVHFSRAGCWLKGFAHESPMTPFRVSPPKVWPGLLDDVPASFSDCLREPAFKMDEVTFCLWRQPDDREWQTGSIRFPHGNDPDGSEYLLSKLDGRPETYHEWASDYYERDIPLTAIEHIYRHQSLTKAILAKLNPELALKDLAGDVAEIGYP